MRTLCKRILKPLLAAGLMSISLVSAHADNHIDVNTPDGVVTAVLHAVKDNRLGVLWDVLPARYQTDVNGLVRAAAAKIDPVLYNQGFTLAIKVTRLLKEKKTFILNHPMLSAIPPDAEFTKEDMVKSWDSGVNTLDILLNSELSNIESLKSLDVGQFLSGTLSTAMKSAYTTTPIPFPVDIDAIKVELVSITGDQAVIKITPPADCKESDGIACQAEERNMTKVDGKWLPTEMVTGWDAEVVQAKAQIAAMKTDELEQMKPQILAGLAMVDGLLSQIDKTATQAEFNAALGGLMGLVMGSMGGPGGPGTPNTATP